MWTPIIPNSQLIVFAPDSQDWGLELFMSPAKTLYMVVACCFVICLILGMAIIALHCQEKQEDRRKKQHNFDFF